jgi:hypothetical protein
MACVRRRSNTRVLNAARSGLSRREKGSSQQCPGLGQQGTQQADAGFLAAGERPWQLVRLSLQPDLGQRLAGPGLPCRHP